MNKKYLVFGILGLFMIAAVTAGAVYYNVFSTTFTAVPSIGVDGDLIFEIEEAVSSGEQVEGSLITIGNSAPSERTISITDNSDEDVEVSYVGTLELTQKDSNCDTIDVVISIDYTVVGDSFNVSGIPVDYELIYYKDGVVGLEGRLDNPQPVIAITSDIGNLPQYDDFNNDADADYCNNEVDNYDSCRGAKLWAVPSIAINGDDTLDWSMMSEFYFETDLVQYNIQGDIIIYSGSDLAITPVYELSDYAEGQYIIETTVA